MSESSLVIAAVGATKELRASLSEYEKSVFTRYQELKENINTLQMIFLRLASIDNSIAFETFTTCSESLKEIIGELSFDINVDRDFNEYISSFLDAVHCVVIKPFDPSSILGLCRFFYRYRNRKSFVEAAEALSKYHHYLLSKDTDLVVLNGVQRFMFNKNFDETIELISNIKQRLSTLKNKLQTSAKQKITKGMKVSDVDLRQDYFEFTSRFSEYLNMVFTQMIFSRSNNRDAIQQLFPGIEALEELAPFVMHVEAEALYLGRSVCGIVLASMEGLIKECKKIGGKLLSVSENAFLAVREFLFNIRRKSAAAEAKADQKGSGIELDDMLALYERENKEFSGFVKAQNEIRKLGRKI